MQQAMKKQYSPVELAQKFIQQEEDSFNLFMAVNKLKTQTENTETQVYDLQAQLEKRKSEQKHSGKRTRAMQKLEEQKEQAEHATLEITQELT